jgi:hypothetical protein
LSSKNDAKGFLGHEVNGVDGKEATDLAEEGKLGELPESHVQGGGN